MLLLLVYIRDTVVEIIGGVAFPGARGHFNYANLFFAKCFSLANSQTFDSRINNRLYGTYDYAHTRARARVARIMTRACASYAGCAKHRHDAMERVVVQLHVNPEPGLEAL